MMIKDTEHLLTYPDTKPDDPMRQYKGIRSYGTVKVNGRSALKVSIYNVAQLERLGFKHIGSGRHYAYVARPQD